MVRRSLGKYFTRRKLESAALALVATTAAVGVAKHGSFIERPVTAPVAELLHRTVSPTPISLADAPDDDATWDLPNIDHAYVDHWVARFTGDLKRSYEIFTSRMNRYDDMIERKAVARGMPKDLVYLAMIESGGDAKARSPVGARGLWQLMAPTARQYGLTSAERTNPEKATDAALTYLEDLYDQFGSWYLAAAAYNTGQGRVARVMKQVTGRTKGTDADFFRIAPKLPKETRDYVPKLIAAARIAKEPEKYGMGG